MRASSRSADATCARPPGGAASTADRPPTPRPRAAGRSTARMPSASAIAHACNGPAPPNATSASSRGSTPRSTVTARTACSIAASTTATTPAASTPARAERVARRVDDRAGRARETSRSIVDATEHEVGVGHRRLRYRRVRSTPGPGVDPALCGPTTSAPPGVDARDRAAARADRVDVERGQPDREPTDRRAAAPARARRRGPGTRRCSCRPCRTLTASG